MNVSAAETIDSAGVWMLAGELGGPVTNARLQPGGVSGVRAVERDSVITVELFGLTTQIDTEEEGSMVEPLEGWRVEVAIGAMVRELGQSCDDGDGGGERSG